MNLNSIIKIGLLLIIVVNSSNIKAQSKDTIFSSDNRQKFASFSLGTHHSISSGGNFMGKGLEGTVGVDFRFQLYIYKQFLVGTSINSSFFNVKDQTIVGGYKKTTVNEEFLFIGYEFLPTKKLRLGVLTSFYGKARFKNKYSSEPKEVFQIDRGNLSNYGVYIKYEVSRSFMLYLDYAYRISKTDINVPAVLNSIFKKGTYHNIGLGITFTMGSTDIFSKLSNK